MRRPLRTSSGSPLEPAGRKLLRLEVRNSQVPIERKPEWIKTRLKTGPEYTELKSLVRREGLHTVCEEAGCPNIYECWEDREATFLIGGDQCTRRCDFCQIDTGKPADFDADEPRRVAESVATMGLKYATVTGVARDDLPDGGAWLYAETVRQIHAQLPGCGVELLIPDFNADPDQLAEVFSSRPEVLAHNVETVPRIFKRIRPGFRFDRSLSVITAAREAGLVTKSNLILGMGEEPHEVVEAMQALHDAGCDLLTITQYLRPSPRHHPVVRWVKPDEFVGFQAEAERIGFPGVLAGPLVRSSYRAGRLYQQADRRPRARRTRPDFRPAARREPSGGGSRPYPGGMARSKPSDATAPGGKAGRGPKAPAAAAPSGATRLAGKAPKLDKEGQPKVGRLKKLRSQAGMIKQAYTLTRKNDPKLPVGHADRLRRGRRPDRAGRHPAGLAVPLPAARRDHRRARRADPLRPARAGLGLPPGRGPAGCGRLGARGHARRLAGQLRRRRHRADRRRPPGARPPGVILVAEGAPTRVRGLLAQEKKKVARVVGDTPIYDIVVGDDEGQVPLRKLSSHVMKLPRNLSAAEVNALGRRMSALGGARMPVPGGRCPAASRCRSASARFAAVRSPCSRRA